MQIFVKDISDKCVAMEVELTDTISSIIKQYMDRHYGGTHGICMDNFKLLYRFQNLNHNETLSFYGIERESTLLILINLRG